MYTQMECRKKAFTGIVSLFSIYILSNAFFKTMNTDFIDSVFGGIY